MIDIFIAHHFANRHTTNRDKPSSTTFALYQHRRIDHCSINLERCLTRLSSAPGLPGFKPRSSARSSAPNVNRCTPAHDAMAPIESTPRALSMIGQTSFPLLATWCTWAADSAFGSTIAITPGCWRQSSRSASCSAVPAALIRSRTRASIRLPQPFWTMPASLRR